MISLVWLRRDLRLHDHAALAGALAEDAPVQPVFVFDTDILKRFSNKKDRRLSFLAERLCAMDAELKKRGGKLLVLHGRAEELIVKLAKELDARVFAAEDYEPETKERDAAVAKKIDLSLVKDHVIFAPGEVLKDDGTPYKVFTPYSKAWRAKLSPSDYGSYAVKDKNRYAHVKVEGPHVVDTDSAAKMLAQIGYEHVDISPWQVRGVSEIYHDFAQERVEDYATARDRMDKDGTSRLSPYLRFGFLSVREAVRAVAPLRSKGAWVFLNELIWREFYMMILAHYPESATKEWNEKYRALDWSYDKKNFAAWQEGRTGYPVVDAAMRQLLRDGWMHNRARMIVASFLTKDLGIDWRLGEEHFAQHLMDYELSSNVGGWQWCASTGTDAQPYFRIFNPYSQSEKFDPNGDYIREYVPELAHIKGKTIHAPKENERGDYPAPMVDHKQAREMALAMFKKV